MDRKKILNPGIQERQKEGKKESLIDQLARKNKNRLQIY